MKPQYDNLAACLSSLCLVHCLAVPLALVAVPAVGQFADALHGPGWIHWLMVAVALPASILALWRGLMLHHDRRPAVLAAGGFALMVAGAAAHGHIGGAGHDLVEPLLTIAGGLVVALGHWRNWGLQRALAGLCTDC